MLYDSTYRWNLRNKSNKGRKQQKQTHRNRQGGYQRGWALELSGKGEGGCRQEYYCGNLSW